MVGKRPSRRSVLKTLGISSLAVGGANAASASDDEIDGNVRKPSGAERQDVLGRARSHDDFQAIHRHLVDEGYTPSPDDDATVTVTEVDGDESEVVTIPYAEPGASGRGDGDASPVVAYRSDQSEVFAYTITERDDEVIVEETYVEGDGLGTDSAAVEFDEEEADALNCVCWEETYGCNNYNWGCVFEIALHLSATYPACQACYVDKTRAICLACLAGALLLGYSPPCYVGSGCGYSYTCIPPEGADGICYNQV